METMYVTPQIRHDRTRSVNGETSAENISSINIKLLHLTPAETDQGTNSEKSGNNLGTIVNSAISLGKTVKLIKLEVLRSSEREYILITSIFVNKAHNNK